MERFMRLDCPESPERIEEIAKNELGETEELKAKCLQEMRMLVRENNLHCVIRDDFSLRFLRTKKFDIQKSFHALQKYSLLLASIHENFLKLRPEVLVAVLHQPHPVFSLLPYRDAEERIIFFMDMGAWDSNICSDVELVMIFVLIGNYLSEKQGSQTAGIVLILDMKDFHLSHVPYLLRHMKFLMDFSFNCLPLRHREVHVLNEHFLLKFFLRLADPFLSKKMKERILIHGNTREEFFQYIPPSILPDHLGGSFGPLTNDHLIEEMVDYLKKMKDEQNYFIQQKH